FHATADRIEDSVGYCGDRGYFAGFTDALRAIRSIPIVAFNKHHFDLRRVPMSEDPRAVKTGSEWLSVTVVIEEVFMERHSNSHERTTFDLASGGQRIHDSSAIVHRKVFENPDMAEFRIDLDLNEVSSKGRTHLAIQCWIRRCRTCKDVLPLW